MDSSYDDSVEDTNEEQIDEDKEVGLEDDAIRENTMSTIGFAANNLHGNSWREKWPCSVVWKFFSSLQDRVSRVQLEI